LKSSWDGRPRSVAGDVTNLPLAGVAFYGVRRPLDGNRPSSTAKVPRSLRLRATVR
jgi:hypothetical protein